MLADLLCWDLIFWLGAIGQATALVLLNALGYLGFKVVGIFFTKNHNHFVFHFIIPWWLFEMFSFCVIRRILSQNLITVGISLQNQLCFYHPSPNLVIGLILSTKSILTLQITWLICDDCLTFLSLTIVLLLTTS